MWSSENEAVRRASRIAMAFVAVWCVLLPLGWLSSRTTPPPTPPPLRVCKNDSQPFEDTMEPLVASRWFDVARLHEMSYRHEHHVDEFGLLADEAMGYDLDLCGVSAVEMGWNVHLSAFRCIGTAVMIANVHYAVCPDQRVKVDVEEASMLCVGPARLTQRYHCIDVSYYDTVVKQPQIKRVFGADAVCVQHHNDVQMGQTPCNDTSGLRRQRCVPQAVVDYGRRRRHTEL